jgi:hypothetical protein
VIADRDGRIEAAFNDAVLLAGRGCRDALARVCRWHVERGMTLPAGIRCGQAHNSHDRVR